MLCEHCHEHPATVHYVMYNNEEWTEWYLCENCAQISSQPDMESFLERWLQMWDEKFSMHSGEQDIPAPEKATEIDEALQRKRRVSELKYRLEQAVAREDYETAATLRDAILREDQKDLIPIIPMG